MLKRSVAQGSIDMYCRKNNVEWLQHTLLNYMRKSRHPQTFVPFISHSHLIQQKHAPLCFSPNVCPQKFLLHLCSSSGCDICSISPCLLSWKSKTHPTSTTQSAITRSPMRICFVRKVQISISLTFISISISYPI